jgi:hypothetical protein
VDEIVRSPKRCMRNLEYVLRDLKGGSFRGVLEVDSHVPIILEWILRAGRLNLTTTFHSSLPINHVRIRGIDLHEFPLRQYYRVVCPAGWHQDVISPREGTERRVSISIGAMTGLRDFVLRVASEWNIELEREEGLP